MISLKPQDIVVLLKLGLEPEAPPRLFAGLAADLGISASEVHSSITRTSAAGLADSERRKPRVRNLLEFLEHGIRYVFVSRRGEITRGFPTAHSTPPLSELLVQGATNLSAMFAKMYGHQPTPGPLEKMYGQVTGLKEEPRILSRMFGDPPLVWPHPDGEVRGEGLEPLYPSAVDAARRDRKLYECLALVDALRVGRAREKNLAIDLLAKRLRSS